MAGKLILVGTPIGNMGDISPRAIQALEGADIIAAEDTRHTGQLLQSLGIKKPMLAYHEHNRAQAGARLMELLHEGSTVALCTDAGMPGISDPGEELVAACAQQGVEVTAIPGPSAFVMGLVLSGLPCGRFAFEGFLPTQGAQLRERLDSLKGERRTLVLYEAPHRVVQTLERLLEAWGDRMAACARELTKLHEEVLRMPLSGLLAHFKAQPPRGEMVLIVAGAPQPAAATRQDIRRELSLALEGGQRLKEAAGEVARRLGVPAREVYRLGLEMKQEQREE
nr:16S rRNA (cytidine(1402)-2'-O)-methyltransferase [bacterium]